MKPVAVKGQNIIFVAPIGWDYARDGECGGLPTRREPYGDGPPFRTAIISNWKPNAEELAMLAAGCVIELACIGGQPPVSISVVPEHKE